MITHVAIWRNDTIYALPKPNRHHNIFQIMDKGPFKQEIQGFLAEPKGPIQRIALFGKDDLPESAYDLPEGQYFLGRQEAFLYAKRIDQLARNPDPKLYQGDELFSEDLW
jgi:hypothetical protein